MAQASLNAGLAFTNAILGATHAMSHQVGGLLDAPHGVVNGVLLPHVIRYNARATPERFVDLAQAAGLPVDGMPGVEAAELLAVHVRILADDVGVPRGLRELGVDEAASTGWRHHARRRVPHDQPARGQRRRHRRAVHGGAVRCAGGL